MSSFRQSRPDYIAVSSDALEDVQVKVAASDASAPLGNGVGDQHCNAERDQSAEGIRLHGLRVGGAGTRTTTRSGRPTSARSSKWTHRPVARSSATNSGSSAATARPSGSLASTAAPPNSTITKFSTRDGCLSTTRLKATQCAGQGQRTAQRSPPGRRLLSVGRLSDDQQRGRGQRQCPGAGVWRKGYSVRLNSTWTNTFSTRISASFNDKALNDTLSDYDGYIGSGPSRPVHAGIFISQGRATGTGELIRLNNIESQFLSPGKKWTVSADATWYKSGLAGSHELQFGMLLQPSMVGVNTRSTRTTASPRRKSS